jgi:hypothetical protein
MSSKLTCAVTALLAASLIGGEFFCVLAAADWAFALQIGLKEQAPVIGAATAALPSLAVAIWFGRSAYRAEREDSDTVGYSDN